MPAISVLRSAEDISTLRPDRRETLEMLAENFGCVSWETDDDDVIWFDFLNDGIIQAGYIPANDYRVSWL